MPEVFERRHHNDWHASQTRNGSPGLDHGDDRRHGWDGPRYDDRHRPDWHRPGWGRPDRRGQCHPNQAVEKARWNGLRRVFIADVSPRRVVVAGVRHGYRDRIVFANVRGCPVIGR
jgi:hypothetical protein